jgi:hypothetical protein
MQTSKCGCVLIELYLWTLTYKFHISSTILFFHFNWYKLFLAHKPHKSKPDLAYSLPTPELKYDLTHLDFFVLDRVLNNTIISFNKLKDRQAVPGLVNSEAQGSGL